MLQIPYLQACRRKSEPKPQRRMKGWFVLCACASGGCEIAAPHLPAYGSTLCKGLIFHAVRAFQLSQLWSCCWWVMLKEAGHWTQGHQPGSGWWWLCKFYWRMFKPLEPLRSWSNTEDINVLQIKEFVQHVREINFFRTVSQRHSWCSASFPQEKLQVILLKKMLEEKPIAALKLMFSEI